MLFIQEPVSIYNSSAMTSLAIIAIALYEAGRWPWINITFRTSQINIVHSFICLLTYLLTITYLMHTCVEYLLVQTSTPYILIEAFCKMCFCVFHNKTKKNTERRTSSKKSPAASPALSATLPGSTASKYWSAGNFSVGVKVAPEEFSKRAEVNKGITSLSPTTS